MNLRKPKIAIIHPAIGKTSGGSQVFVLELAQRLCHDFDITIFSGTKVNKMCTPVFSLTRRTVDNAVYRALLRLLSKFSNSPDIVIEHLSSFLPVFLKLMTGNYDIIFPNNDWGGLLAACAVRKIKKTPIVFTEHAGLLDNGKIAARNLKFKPDRYITLTNETNNRVNKHFPNIKTAFIPNGVDLSVFNPEVKPINLNPALNLQRPIFLAAGRYYPNKRLELVIDAVSHLKKGSLVILSGGDNIDNLKDYGSQKLGKRFLLTESSYNEMPAYYNYCDVFTLPSQNEPFGLVYLEAMACNKPVVTVNDESRIYIIGNGGLLCDVTNIQQYAETLETAVNTDFGDKPYTQAKKFSLDKTAQMYRELFYSICQHS